MGKILFMTHVAADAKGAETHATEQLRAIDTIHDLIERRDELDSREEVTLLEAFRSLGCLDESVVLEQQVIAVHVAAYDAIAAFHDAHDEDPSDEQLTEMRVQAAQDMGAEDVVILLEHDPDRYQGFMERFFDVVTRKLKEERPSKGGANG